MTSPRSEDYAYLAGLIDGEGWVGSTDNGIGISPRIQIGMTNLPVLDWCKEMFGGSIHAMSRKEGCKASWKWNMGPGAIREHLPLVVPYMKVKKAHALIVIDWTTNYVGGRGKKMTPVLRAEQEALQLQLKALNR